MENVETLWLVAGISDIRIGTSHDWQDASQLAARVFRDRTSGWVTRQLFAATAAYLAYSGEQFQASYQAHRQNQSRLDNLVFFVFDPGWDSSMQVVCHIHNYFSGDGKVAPCAERVVAVTHAVLDLHRCHEVVAAAFMAWRGAINKEESRRYYRDVVFPRMAKRACDIRAFSPKDVTTGSRQ